MRHDKKKIIISIIFGILVSSFLNCEKAHALGEFDIKSKIISKPINEYKVQVAPGVIEKRYTFEDNEGKRVESFLLEVDTKYPKVSIKAGTSGDGQVWGKQTVKNQAKAYIVSNKKIVAGVNADFYDMSTGQPIGIVYKDGKVIKKIKDKTYTRFFGICKDNTPIIGDISNYNSVKGNLMEALGGNAILVKNGKVNETPKTGGNKEPRTAVGIKRDGKVIFVTIDGRQEPYSAGISMNDLAEFMIGLGVVDALNLDGGGSSTFVSKVPGNNNLQVKNKPSDGSERAVANSWLIESKVKSDGKFKSAYIEPYDKSFTPNSKINFSVKGKDLSGDIVPIPQEGLKWLISDNSFGTIDEKGIFISSGKEGQFTVKLIYNGVEVGSTYVEITTPNEIYFESSTLSIKKKSIKKLSPIVRYDGRDVIWKKGDIIFNVPERIGCVDEDGVLYVVNNNVNDKIVAKIKNNNISANININVGQGDVIVEDFEKGIGKWYINTASRGEKGSLSIALKGKEPVKSGDRSLKINFDFTKGNKKSTLGVYAAPGEVLNLQGMPKNIGMWIYGTNESKGYWLRMAVVDSRGNTKNMNITNENGIDWIGWKYVKVEIPSSAINELSIDKNQGIRILSVNSGDKGPMTKGSIYVDDIMAIYSESEITNPDEIRKKFKKFLLLLLLEA